MDRSPVEVVQDLYYAFGHRDEYRVFSLLAPEVEFRQSAELPWGGSYRGHEGARQFFGKLSTHLSSTLEIERMIRSGDYVTAVGWTQGRVNANGVSFRVPIAHVWKVRHGLVIRVRFLIDNPMMLEAMRRERR